MNNDVSELGPVCEGCGQRTHSPTWYDMDPFCPACVKASNVEPPPWKVLFYRALRLIGGLP